LLVPGTDVTLALEALPPRWMNDGIINYPMTPLEALPPRWMNDGIINYPMTLAERRRHISGLCAQMASSD
jgi:hypothetical protein